MTLESIVGSAWMFGDNVDTDAIYPGKYMHILDKKNMASHAFEFLKPAFAQKVEPKDIIIGGRNFGCGSSREHAVMCLKHNGVGAIIAMSFARIFYRNAVNNGIPVLTFDIEPKDLVEVYSNIMEGDDIEMDFSRNLLETVTTGERFKINPLPDHLLEIIEAGGLIEYTKNKTIK